MKLRPILLVSVALGLVVLVPIPVVVGLGLYGSSIGGQSTAVAATGAELRLVPASGSPGATITVSGRNWEPREEIAIYVDIPESAATGDRRVRLLSVTASRSGAFEVDLVFPALILTSATTVVTVEAESLGQDASPSEVRANFGFVGYETEIEIHVVDARRGGSLSGARVQISDGFGQLVATVTTDLAGIATFAGVRPGVAGLNVSLLDYQHRQTTVTVPQSGSYDFQVELTPSPSQRLLIPHPDSLGGGLLMYGLLDRASGLALDSIASVRLRGVRLERVLDPGIEYRFVLPAEIRISMEGDSGSAQPPRALSSILAVVNSLKGFSERRPSHVYYAGNTGVIDVVFAIDDSYWATQSLYLVDGRSFRILRRVRFGPESLPPVLSRDRSRIYVLNWFTRRVDVLSAATGGRIERIDWLPPFIGFVTADPDSGGLYLISSLSGVISRFNVEQGTVADEIATVAGATGLVPDPRRDRLYVFGEELDFLTVIDPDTGEIDGVFPLEQPIEWLWVDPEGLSLFAGVYAATWVQIIDAASLEVLTTVDLPSVPRPRVPTRLPTEIP